MSVDTAAGGLGLGLAIVSTMARLGHSTPEASLRYQQRMSGRDAEIADALSELAETEP
jgi:hypothetical protein